MISGRWQVVLNPMPLISAPPESDCPECCECPQDFRIFAKFSERHAEGGGTLGQPCPTLSDWSAYPEEWIEHEDLFNVAGIETSFFPGTPDPLCPYFISSQYRSKLQFRFRRPKVGKGRCLRIVIAVGENRFPSGGGDDVFTLRETLCLVWDGEIPEDYDPADVETWPRVEAEIAEPEEAEAAYTVLVNLVHWDGTENIYPVVYCDCRPCP